ncbi:MAG: hypothetical protein U0941_17095 [Planctomycetaceae bacterium]
MNRCLNQILTGALMGLNFFVANPSIAEDHPAPVTTVQWEKLKAEDKLKSGEVVVGKEGQSSWLKIVNTDAGLRSIPLCVIDAPAITTPSYAVRGRIRYENVTGVGFLEMWNHFGAGEQYFTRTMGTDGPMQMVTGTSEERDFELPFHTGGQAPAPKKLVLNLVLNGPGTVEIGPLELVSIEPMAGLTGGSEWWNGQTAGWLGGLGGTVIGILGAAIGVLAGMGRAKKLILAMSALATVVGVFAVASGIYAVIIQQPYSVYYVLLMLGGYLTIGGMTCLIVIPYQFRMRELRRMQALDA